MAQKLSMTDQSDYKTNQFNSFHLPKDLKLFHSSQNSPSTMPETPSESNWLASFKEDYNPTLKTELVDKHQSAKLKGLEEIGLFSDFQFTKSFKNIDSDNTKKSTINISDFMMENNKRNILKGAGGLDKYFAKKRDFGKESVLRDKQTSKFFMPSEKKPEFFHTPPISPKFKVKNKKVESRVELIDGIMSKCDLAIGIRLPGTMHKSISPKYNEPVKEKNWKCSSLKISKPSLLKSPAFS